ncbi:hypothetical protein ACHAP5_012057 [Fusarium lateritium]
MAEVFGAVTGAIGVTALFNNCIDCFDYVQIARHFGQDFSRYQLRLDVAKCRLARWGATVNINNNSRLTSDPFAHQTTELAMDILKEIIARFETARKISRRYETRLQKEARELCTESDLNSVSQTLHNRFRALTTERQNRIGLLKKTTWALYDKEHMGRMIADIITSIKDLEEVFPAKPGALSQLVEMEVEEIDNEQELDLMQQAAEGLDPVLEDVSRRKLQEVTSRNSAGRIIGKGHVNVGHIYGDKSFSGFKNNTTNHVDEVNGEETSRVNIGNTYGGKGFWD